MDGKRGSRPQGTDGQDFRYRQRLDPRYGVRFRLDIRLIVE